MTTIKTTLAAAAFAVLAVPASAATIILDFDTASKIDIFGEETGVFDHAGYGFSVGMTRSDVIGGIFDAVVDHFLGYVSAAVDPLSPLMAGFELDLDFAIGQIGLPPVGASDFYYFGIGPDATGASTLYGQACTSCARDALGAANSYGLPDGSLVGSVFTNSILSSAILASSDAQLINLIAGTTSHEIAHSLSLLHDGAKAANPGGSDWGVMGSGATAMPNNQRVLEREFTYDNYAQLISAVGLREIDAAEVPLPASLLLLLSGLAGLAVTRRCGARA